MKAQSVFFLFVLATANASCSAATVQSRTAYRTSRPLRDPIGASRAMPAHASSPQISMWDIVGTAMATGEFSTFLELAQRSGILHVLRSPGPFTAFIPSNAAFERLPPGFLAALTRPEHLHALRATVAHHILSGDMRLAAASRRRRARSLYGAELAIQQTSGGLIFETAAVIEADIGCLNGVIHAIDRVLVPESVQEAITTELNGSGPTYDASPAPVAWWNSPAP